MGDVGYPYWQRAYRNALLEVDLGKLPARIFDAETAIVMRLTTLRQTSDGNTERHAIEDALRTLLVLKNEKLDYPTWEES